MRVRVHDLIDRGCSQRSGSAVHRKAVSIIRRFNLTGLLLVFRAGYHPRMSLPCYLLAALHGFMAVTHLKDPAQAVKDMVGISSTSHLARHLIAIIGAMHLFVCVLMAMCARVGAENGGHRKCILGIYLITAVPALAVVQFVHPVLGEAPGMFEMPMPILYVMTGLAILGLATGGNKDKSA